MHIIYIRPFLRSVNLLALSRLQPVIQVYKSMTHVEPCTSVYVARAASWAAKAAGDLCQSNV